MSLMELLSRYGSPLYVYDLERVQAALSDLRAALPDRITIYYSLKANPHVDIARQLHLNGCRAEISSTGELAAAVVAGFMPGDYLYTGPAKTLEEITVAIQAGVRRFSVESAADFQRVSRVAAEHGTRVDCLIRISAGAAGSSSLRMTGTGSQFGTPLAQVLAAPEAFAEVAGGRIGGVHFFPLSNARDEDSLIAELVGSVGAAAQLQAETPLRLLEVNVGGGFAAPYARPGARPVYSRLRAALTEALDAQLPGWRTGDPSVAVESGRYLVGDCGSMVCTVVEVKQHQDSSFVLLDSGINHLGGMAGLGRLLPLSVMPVDGPQSGELAENLARATLVGPLCTPADVLSRNVDLGAVVAGQPLVIPNVGAYGLTASLVAFLGRPIPTEVVVRDGQVISASRLQLERTQMPVHDYVAMFGE